MPTISQPSRKELRDERRRARVERETAERAVAARRRRLTRLGAVLGAAAIVVAVLVAVSTSGSGSGPASRAASSARGAPAGAVPGAAATTALFAGIPQHGTTLGSPTAPVRVVEFADLQCPFCRDYSLTEMPSLVRQYVRPGKVSMRFQPLTFIGPDSVRAARVAAAAASQDRLWSFADLMYRNQGTENSGYATDAYLRRLAAAVPGLDTRRVFTARNGAAVTRRLEAAQAAATAARVNSTPTFLVQRGSSTKVVDVAGLPAAIKAAVAS
jgi:protein-disulfide isomerase